MAISALGSLSAAHRAVQRATPLVVAYASSADGLLLSTAKRARAQRRSPSVIREICESIFHIVHLFKARSCSSNCPACCLPATPL